jgi:putative ABC transport system permease protein
MATSSFPIRYRCDDRDERSGGRDERSRVDVMLQDLRYSLRLLLHRPGFTAVAVLSLALGLGGSSLIFGLVDGLVLRPFAYPDADRLVTINVSLPKQNSDRFIEVLSPPEFLDIRGARTLVQAQAFDLGNRHVSGGDQPERLFTALVFGDLFPTIGLRAHLGRGFTKEELAPGGPAAAVISHRVWRTRFGGDLAIVGRAIRVNGVTTTVVGVMPPELVLLGTDMWLPLQADPAVWGRGARNFTMLARVAPGATLTQVNAELGAIAARATATYGAQFKDDYDGWDLTAVPWATALMRPIQPAAWLLLGAIGFVLLIVCVNLANLQLARASTRQREMAIRVALGAGSWRVGRQLLIESLLLAGTGCALGLVVAILGLRGSQSILPAEVASLDPRIEFSGRVLVVSMALALIAGVVVGVLPAFRAMRADPFDTLKRDSRTSTAGASTNRLRYGLIVAEIALAMILLVGAGLLTRTMLRLSNVASGVDANNVLTMRLTLPREKYQGAAVPAFFEQIVERVRGIAGVRSAAMASQFPPRNAFGARWRLEGRAADASGAPIQSDFTVVSPGLFRTLAIPFRTGRDFTTMDGDRAPRVAIVNESFARRVMKGASPVGLRIAMDDKDAQWTTIVGVVADTRGRGVRMDARPEVYLPAQQNAVWNQLFLLVRTEGDPRGLLSAVRREIQALDRDQPVYAIQTLEEAFASTLFTQRALMTLLAAFALLAVALASIGIYAVMSHAVTARTQEIGIRMALGAAGRAVRGMVMRQVLWLVAIGIAIGMAGALALGRVVSGVLSGTAPDDPLTLAIVMLILASVALVAGYVPARRASRIDPIVALRTE